MVMDRKVEADLCIIHTLKGLFCFCPSAGDFVSGVNVQLRQHKRPYDVICLEATDRRICAF